MYLRGRKCSTRSPLLGEPPARSPGHTALAGLPGGAISMVAAPQGYGACGGPPTGTSESLHSAGLVSGQLAISGPPLRGSLQVGCELGICIPAVHELVMGARAGVICP